MNYILHNKKKVEHFIQNQHKENSRDNLDTQKHNGNGKFYSLEGQRGEIFLFSTYF